MFRSTLPAVAVALLAASAGRADTLDEAIATESKTLVKMLAKAGYKTVGTLPFGLKVGDRKIEMNGGAINALLPEYLQTALVQATAVKRELTLLRNAAREAEKVKGGDPNTPVGRKALLEHKYPTWSGDKPEAPDVLISGVIAVQKDLRTATIHMIALDPKADAPAKLHVIPVDCDQFLLSDCGIGVSYASRAKGVSGFTKSVGLFDSIADDLTPATKPMTTDKPPVDPKPMVDPKPAAPFPVQMRILYDDEEQIEERELGGSASDLNPTTFKIKQPKEGQKVTLKLKNLQKYVVGAVVFVGGKSTLNGHTHWKDSERWVLDPDKEVTIRGFYRTVDGKDVVDPFVVLSAAESISAFHQRGESAGRIELHVFQPVSEEVALARENTLSLRTPAALKEKPPGDLVALMDELVKKQGGTNGGKGIIEGSKGGGEGVKLEDGKLGKVDRTDTKIIKYYTRDDAK